ncbi:1,4-dihydropyridine esterase [Streptomyces sp. NPDC051018]|uniref:1,4-dihydropyridine esterase n=1 Tax=Streptomyces sp. NPDC051018 TaxID=3365639 RepID=UPI0037AEFE7E
MYRQAINGRRAAAVAVALLTALGSAGGVSGPASAQGTPPSRAIAPDTGTDTDTGTGTGTGRSFTLGTGDQVVVGADGKSLGYRQAKGREHIPLATQVSDGRTYVVPLDVSREFAAGGLDRRRFDITGLTGGAPGTAEPASRTAAPEPASRPGGVPDATASRRGTAGNRAETHELTLHFIGRDGKVGKNYEARVEGVSGPGADTGFRPDASSGTVTLRVPEGRYVLEAVNDPFPEVRDAGYDLIVQPWLEITGNTTVTVDARTAEPARFTVPDAKAAPHSTAVSYRVEVGDDSVGLSLPVPGRGELRTAHLGPPVTDGSLTNAWEAMWQRGSTDYKIVLGDRVERLATGITKHFRDKELATVKVGMGSSAPGTTGSLQIRGYARGSWWSTSPMRLEKTPTTRTLRLSTADGAWWPLEFGQIRELPDGGWIFETSHRFASGKSYEAGRTYREAFNAGVLAPLTGDDHGVFREGNILQGRVPLLADGQGQPGWVRLQSARTRLYRDGALIGENDDPLSGSKGSAFVVPPGEAMYTLETSVARDPSAGTATSRLDASWTFRSGETAAMERIPLSAARFLTPVDLASTAPAGARQSVAVELQGPAALPGKLSSLEVRVSYDRGETWRKVTVRKLRFTVANPAEGKGISFRAVFGDTDGNKNTVSVIDAYYGR